MLKRFTFSLAVVAALVLVGCIPIEVILTSPNNATHSAGTNTTVVVNFGGSVSTDWVNHNTFIMHGMMQGKRTGTYSVVNSGTKMATWTPTAPFFPGEPVFCTITAGILSQDGAGSVAPHVWSFRTKTYGGTGTFSDSGQGLGDALTLFVRLGDLNGDGHLDAVVGNYGTHSKVWVNDGSGTFSEGQTLWNSYARSASLGDLDGDGDLDLFVPVALKPSEVWLNDGSGTFTDSGQSVGGADGASQAALGDADGDGDLDALVSSLSVNGLVVWLNDGAGAFSKGPAASVSPTFSLSPGDLDGDGDIDLATVSLFGGAEIWTNNGSGAFSAGQSLGGDVYAVSVGDVNGDGRLDVFLGGYDDDEFDHGNKVWLNNGAGTFTDSGQSLGDSETLSVELLDVDGDGDLDAFAGNFGANKVWLNNGSGTFADSGQSFAAVDTYSVSVGDVDGDGDLDVFEGKLGPNRVWLNQNPPPPPSTVAVTSTVPVNAMASVGVSSVLTARVDQALAPATVNSNRFKMHSEMRGWLYGSVSLAESDRRVDLDPTLDFLPGERVFAELTSGIEGSSGDDLKPYIWSFDAAVTNGNGTFTDSGQSLGNVHTEAVSLGDLDGDGDLDAFVGNSSQPNKVWLNNGSGVFTDSGQNLGSGQTGCVSLGDVDGDGDLDAFEGNFSTNRLWMNDGNGMFSLSGQNLGSTANSAVLGDVDGDGDLDIVLVNAQGNGVWRNDGTGVFADSGQSIRGDSVTLGDVDGDGDLDGLATCYLSMEHWPIINDGTGVFSYSRRWCLQAQYNIGGPEILGDVDGDGDLDAFTWPFSGGALKVLLNDGSGAFVDSSRAFGDYAPEAMALGDVDGDGDLDAFVAHSGSSSSDDGYPNKVWTNDGSGVFFDSGQNLGNGFSESVRLGDLDGDGDLDAFVGNSGPNKVWLNNFTPVPPPVTITNITPSNALVGVAKSDSIQADFSAAVMPETVSNRFKAYGEFSGWHTGTVTVTSGDKLATLDPVADFLSGERVLAVAANGMVSVGNGVVVPRGWTFRTAVSASPGLFLDSGQSLGSASSVRAAVGDVDGDGDLDVVVANSGPNAVWLNDGSGNLSNSGQSLGTAFSQDVALGDVDEDGDLDAFVANYNTPSVLYTNRGDGTFLASSNLMSNPNLNAAACQYNNSVALTDVNLDGSLDAVELVDTMPDRVWINDGAGFFFEAEGRLATGETLDDSAAVAAGDLDDDGDMDLMITYQSRGSIVWTNDGRGRFSQFGSPIGTNSPFVALGDVDGDGDLDALLRQGGTNTLFTNNGSAAFSDSGTRFTPIANALRLDDLDGDGDLDVFGASSSPNHVWKNDGSGNFTKTAQTLGDRSSFDAAAGDFDGDGDLDMFVANSGEANTLWLNRPLPPILVINTDPVNERPAADADTDVKAWFNSGVVSGEVTTARFKLHSSQFGWKAGTVSQSVDNVMATLDPTTDFAPGERVFAEITSGVTNFAGAEAKPHAWGFRTAVHGGTGVFTTNNIGPTDPATGPVRLVDLNGDGQLDAFFPKGAGNAVWTNDGSGTLVAHQTGMEPFSTLVAVEFGDFDEDGDLDAFLSDNAFMMYLFTNSGTGTLAEDVTQFWPAQGALDARTGDLDGDGDLDLFMTLDVGAGVSAEVHTNNGSGVFGVTTQLLGLAGAAFEALDIGDIDNDGDLDAVVSDPATLYTNEIWLNNGSGIFSNSAGLSSNTNVFHELVLGDLDGDDDLDIYFMAIGAENEVWTNNGAGVFARRPQGQTLSTSAVVDVELGDLDWDGDLDVFLAGGFGIADEVWLNDGQGQFSPAPQALGSNDSYSLSLGTWTATEGWMPW